MKETELQNTSETSKAEVQNLSAQDKARKHRKTAKAAISFIVMILLLVALFFAAVNIGSLKVSFPELLKGLFVEYNEDVATIYDLTYEYFGMSATFKYPQALEELQPILYPESDEDTQKAKEASDNAQKKAKDSDATEKYNEQQSK